MTYHVACTYISLVSLDPAYLQLTSPTKETDRNNYYPVFKQKVQKQSSIFWSSLLYKVLQSVTDL